MAGAGATREVQHTCESGDEKTGESSKKLTVESSWSNHARGAGMSVPPAAGLLLQGFFKIEMMVVAACRIERRRTGGAARFALQVFANGKLCAAGTAKNGLLVEFAAWPNLDGMAGERDVAVLAGVVRAAALHFDGDNVRRRMVVHATRLRIEMQPADFRAFWIGRRTSNHFLFS
jgi:hypothetical protein